VGTAPMSLVSLADDTRMKLVPAAQREAYAFAIVGAMAQGVSFGHPCRILACVITTSLAAPTDRRPHARPPAGAGMKGTTIQRPRTPGTAPSQPENSAS